MLILVCSSCSFLSCARYVIISLTKISVDSFALPMMASVEEAGESKFQSDLSRTALGTAHESGALSGGGEHWRGAAPGSTPAIGGRKLGGPAGVSDDIAEVGEEEEQLLINRSRQVSPQVTPQVGGRSVPAPVGNGQTDRANEDFLGLTTPPAEVELVHIRPSSRTGEQPTHDQVVASVLGNGGLSDAPAHRAGSAGPSGRASPRASNVPRSSSDGISPPAPMNSGNGPRVTLPPTLTQGGFPSASSSAASAVPRKVRPYTHVPLQPSSIPSSEPTLIDLTRDTDRPAVFMQGGTNNGSTGGGIARENLPAMGNSKLGRDQSSSRASSANTFISENVIIEIRSVQCCKRRVITLELVRGADTNYSVSFVSVTDTGMGIDPAALPLLFEPYSQAKLSVMRSFGGQFSETRACGLLRRASRD
jgi:hypothetical protein